MIQAETTESAAGNASGKLVIIGIVIVALAAAGTSWWFRYNATHRAVRFWGPEAAVLIRDAPKVTLFRMPSAEIVRLAEDDAARARFDDSAYDITKARGLVHLRNALLDDRSFIWPRSGEPWPNPVSDIGHWYLSFHDPQSSNTVLMMFSKDCRQAARLKLGFAAYNLTSISTEPIAAGLAEMFGELSTAPPVEADDPSR